MPISGAGRTALFSVRPDDYLLAGIGDTLAKWYEAGVAASRRSLKRYLNARLGINSACAIRDPPAGQQRQQALADKQQRRLNPHFATWWMIIAGGGMVGGPENAIPVSPPPMRYTTVLTRPPQTEKIPARNESGLWHSGAKRATGDKMTCWRN